MKVFQRQNKTTVFPSTQNLNLAELSQLRGTRVQPLTSGSPPCVEPRQTPTGMETILAVPACETHTRDHRATPLNALCPAQPPSRCSTGEEGAREDFLKNPFHLFSLQRDAHSSCQSCLNKEEGTSPGPASAASPLVSHRGRKRCTGVGVSTSTAQQPLLQTPPPTPGQDLLPHLLHSHLSFSSCYISAHLGNKYQQVPLFFKNRKARLGSQEQVTWFNFFLVCKKLVLTDQ